MEGREPVIVFANCQGSILSWIFNHSPTIARKYCFEQYQNFHDRAKMAREVPASVRERCPLFVHQTGEWGQDCDAFQGLPDDCSIIHIPSPVSTALYPLVRPWPAHPPLLRRKFDVFWELADKHAIKLIESDLSKEEYLKIYFATDILSFVNPVRMHELDMKRLRKLDGYSNFPIANYVESRFCEEQLFHTRAHLSNQFYFHIAYEMLNAFVRCRVPYMVENETVIRAEIDDFQHASGPLHMEVQIPIHPHVASSLQLRWFDPGTIYENRDYENWTFSEFIEFLFDYVKH